MKKSSTIKHVSFLIALLFTFVFSTALIVDKSGNPGSKDPVKLAYSFSDGKTISFNSVMTITQAMDVNGQTMNVLVNQNLAFKAKMVGKVNENFKLEIKMDSLIAKVETPQGSTGGRISEVEGKTFNMILSPLGKEIDISEAAKIEYTIEGTQGGNLSQFFANVFPDLPEKPVNSGDTWTKNDSVISNSSNTKTTQIIQSNNKFEGMEKINGIDCAKITSTIMGTMETTTQNQGMDILYKGPMQGTVTLYFAVKEGYSVSQEVSTKMTGTVDISGAQNMTFPVVMETNKKIQAIK
jgi:hypothetical protein